MRPSGLRLVTVDAFLRRYEAAFSALDVAAIADCYRLPAVFVNPIQTRTVETRAELERQLGRITGAHRRSPWHRAEGRRRRVDPHGGHFVDLRVHWTVFTADDEVLWDFEQSYLLQADAGGWRIAVAIGH